MSTLIITYLQSEEGKEKHGHHTIECLVPLGGGRLDLTDLTTRRRTSSPAFCAKGSARFSYKVTITLEADTPSFSLFTAPCIFSSPWPNTNGLGIGLKDPV